MLEFVMRIKLPESSCSPSGDTEFEIAYDKVLKENCPSGFIVQHQRIGEKWAKDSEGFTYVRLKLVKETETFNYLITKNKELEKELSHIKGTLKRLVM
jgi:hypothetical protein